MSRRRRSPPRARRWWIAAVGLVVAAILWITLRPDAPPFPTGTNFRPLEHHGRALQAFLREPPNQDEILYYLVTDVLGNVLLFLPLGFVTAGALRGRPPVRRLAAAAGFGALLSAGIEGLQLLVPGRATDVDDVIFNGLGTLVGASILLVGERVAGARSSRGAGRKRRSGRRSGSGGG